MTSEASHSVLIVIVVIGIAVVLLLLRRFQARKSAANDDAAADSSSVLLRDRCNNPDCVRCKNYEKFTQASLQTSLARVKARLDISALPRIDAAVAETRLAERASNQRPTVFFVPGLTARPLWVNNAAIASSSSSSSSSSTVSVEKSVRPLLREMDLVTEEIADFVYQCAAHGDMAGWRANDSVRGNWDVFPLVSQGHVFAENAARLPLTWRALQLVDGAACAVGARRSCFGNAFVSVLSPDTAIAAHCGPTNVRLRMHVPIRVPDDAASSLRVGGDSELVRWENGTWLLFDDSFEHAARNDSAADDRIALIVDLWHPELSGEEREAITEMFGAV
jgi:hypothetical protein